LLCVLHKKQTCNLVTILILNRVFLKIIVLQISVKMFNRSNHRYSFPWYYVCAVSALLQYWGD